MWNLEYISNPNIEDLNVHKFLSCNVEMKHQIILLIYFKTIVLCYQKFIFVIKSL